MGPMAPVRAPCDTVLSAGDTTQCTLRHDVVRAAWAQCAFSVREAWALGVRTVHSTQF